MQISLKVIRLINHAKITVCIKFQFPVTFSSLFTGSSSLSVFPRSVLYVQAITDGSTGKTADRTANESSDEAGDG